ncbi:MAG TPA: GxxExxY protein [Methanocorpusculum sp.]|nr:GxxExxY protein [Methanocorpusculum sp.]
METLSDEDKIDFDEVHKIVGCAFEVYNRLGVGFLEQVYQEALELELKYAEIPFDSQKHIPVYYRGEELNAFYKADIVCFNKVIVELKAEKKLSDSAELQLINYLKATGYQTGILLNFGHRGKLEWKKIVFTNTKYLKNISKD